MFDKIKKFLANMTDSDSATAAQAFYRELRPHVGFILPPGVQFRLARWSMGKPLEHFRGKCIVTIEKHRLKLYPQTPTMHDYLSFDIDGLMWFQRPLLIAETENREAVYANAVDMHIYDDAMWYALYIECTKSNINTLMSTIKSLAPFYYRPRAYTPFAPAKAQLATQDLQGSWNIEKGKVNLYLSADELVISSRRNFVQLNIADMSYIQVLQRMDSVLGGGLIRCQYKDDSWAFALPDYEAFAMTLAERTQAPIEWLTDRKGKRDKY